ncbi:hypothetical protein ABZP36_006141 [Zizania latifolia]
MFLSLVSELKPDDFLHILIGFGQDAVEVKKDLYRWASWQSKAFQHLPRSNEIMVSILADAQMLTQAESLLLLLDGNRALGDASELFSQIIQAYAEAGHLGKSMLLYDCARCGIFREGLYRHAKYVFEDMAERKVVPELLTYRILLAGYCRYRQFDDIEQILRTMESNGVNDIPSGNYNAVGFPKAEFFDSVSNGLYLDTDSRKLEISLVRIIDNALYPDISSDVISACQKGDVASALVVKDEAFQWGHDISPASYSELLKAICVSPAHAMDAINLIEDIADTPDKFDAQNLNLVVQTLSKNGMSPCARLVLDRLFRDGLPVSQDTYTCLMIGFCTERNIEGFWECWNLATKRGWSPGSKDVIPLISHLGKWGVIEEALEFISVLLDCYPSLFFSAYCQLLKELCMTGCTSVGCAMLEALIEKGVIVDPSLICNVMEGFLKEQKTAESIGMYDMLLNRNKVLNALTYRFALSSIARIDAERAMDLGLMPSNRSLRVVLSHYCRLGNLEKSLKLFHLIERNGWKHGLVIEATLISCLLSSGRFSEATTSCLNSMNKRTLIGFDLHFDALIKEFCILGDVEMSVNLLNMILKKGKVPSDVGYSFVVYRLCMLKEFDQALDFLTEMKFTDIKPSDMPCDVLIHGLCAMGRPYDAVTILEMLTTIGSAPSYDMYRVVFDGYCRSNNLQKAATLLHDMQQAGYAPNFEMHWSVISNLSSTVRRTEGYEDPILSNLISSTSSVRLMKENRLAELE